MSLRQLKFKPKIQPNAAKTKTDSSGDANNIKKQTEDVSKAMPSTIIDNSEKNVGNVNSSNNGIASLNSHGALKEKLDVGAEGQTVSKLGCHISERDIKGQVKNTSEQITSPKDKNEESNVQSKELIISYQDNQINVSNNNGPDRSTLEHASSLEKTKKEANGPVLKEVQDSFANEVIEAVVKKLSKPIGNEVLETVAKEVSEPVVKEVIEPAAKEVRNSVTNEDLEPIVKEVLEPIEKQEIKKEQKDDNKGPVGRHILPLRQFNFKPKILPKSVKTSITDSRKNSPYSRTTKDKVNVNVEDEKSKTLQGANVEEKIHVQSKESITSICDNQSNESINERQDKSTPELILPQENSKKQSNGILKRIEKEPPTEILTSVKCPKNDNNALQENSEHTNEKIPSDITSKENFVHYRTVEEILGPDFELSTSENKKEALSTVVKEDIQAGQGNVNKGSVGRHILPLRQFNFKPKIQAKSVKAPTTDLRKTSPYCRITKDKLIVNNEDEKTNTLSEAANVESPLHHEDDPMFKSSWHSNVMKAVGLKANVIPLEENSSCDIKYKEEKNTKSLKPVLSPSINAIPNLNGLNKFGFTPKIKPKSPNKFINLKTVAEDKRSNTKVEHNGQTTKVAKKTPTKSKPPSDILEKSKDSGEIEHSPLKKCKLAHESVEKVPEKNISTILHDVFRNKAVHGSKSIRSCHRAVPAKPKLTKRSKRPFATSTFGKMSFEAKQNFIKKFGNETPDTSKLTMLDLIFYNPSTNPMPKPEEHSESSNKKDKTKENDKINVDKNILENVEKKKNEDNDKKNDIDNTLNDKNSKDSTNNDDVPVPQLKLSADGKIIVAQESLVVKQSLGEISADVEFIGDGTRRKRRRKRKSTRYGWTYTETLKFYKALNTIGSDFELMKSIFPDRSRYNLKSKFKREERVHGELIDKAMSMSSEFNVEEVLEELELDRKLEEAKATLGRSLQIKKPTVKRKKHQKDPGDLTTKEIRAILRRCDEEEAKKKKILEEEAEGGHEKDHENTEKKNTIPDKCSQKEVTYCLRKKVNPPDRLQCVLASPPAVNKETLDKNDHIVISTNIEYDNVKFTQYITYNSNNLENPVEVNATISHESDSPSILSEKSVLDETEESKTV